MVLKTIQFVAMIFTALPLVRAHLFAPPNTISVLQNTYYVVDPRWFVVFIGALIADAVLAVLVRDQLIPFWFAVIGFVAIAATLAIFFLWIFPPANQLTMNLTTLPDGRQPLLRWEYGYAATAILTFIGLCAVTCSVLSYRE